MKRDGDLDSPTPNVVSVETPSKNRSWIIPVAMVGAVILVASFASAYSRTSNACANSACVSKPTEKNASQSSGNSNSQGSKSGMVASPEIVQQGLLVSCWSFPTTIKNVPITIQGPGAVSGGNPSTIFRVGDLFRVQVFDLGDTWDLGILNTDPDPWRCGYWMPVKKASLSTRAEAEFAKRTTADAASKATADQAAADQAAADAAAAEQAAAEESAAQAILDQRVSRHQGIAQQWLFGCLSPTVDPASATLEFYDFATWSDGMDTFWSVNGGEIFVLVKDFDGYDEAVAGGANGQPTSGNSWNPWDCPPYSSPY